MLLNVLIASARKNSSVLAVGAPLALPCSFASEAQQARLDADFRAPSSLGKPSFHYVHDNCYPFTLEDRDR
jgi:hypothetical protein